MIIDQISLRSTPQPDYVSALPAVDYLRDLPYFRFHSPVTLFTGANGAGKTTLLDAVAQALGFKSTGGRFDSLNPGRPSRVSLAASLRLQGDEAPMRGFFLRAETHAQIIEDADAPRERGGRSITDTTAFWEHRSHGQSIGEIVEEHVHGGGIYIFDEPEAGLSVISQLALSATIAKAAAKGAQFIIATHSPILLGCPGADIVQLDDAGFNRVAFEDTEPVAATREFLADPQGTMDFILGTRDT